MICGIGTDIVDVERILTAYKRHGEKFYKRILSASEQALMEKWPESRQAEFMAGRFAAKEAIGKACGLGIGLLQMNCVEIALASQGLSVTFCPQAAGLPHTQGRWHVSISHTPSVAYAVAVWEDDDANNAGGKDAVAGV